MMDNFVKTLIEEVKSQGVFDEFRFNCCLADVDTKPAYQNVRNRVETAVNDFLAKQHWTPDTNKVQLRERLRKHLLDSDVLDKGVDHIVDQVVNPKVATIFEPKIESIAYKYLGITPPPPPTNPPPRPPLLPAPPLPPYPGHTLGHINGNMLNVETSASLLPTDLEQISPDSDRATFKSDIRDDELPPGVDDDDMDYDETTSPAFEPAADIKEDIKNVSLNTSDSIKDVKELANDSRDAGASQASQLSQVSSDSRLTIASTDAPQPTSANNSVELTSNIAANMSEEAQMPKFNENSSEANENSGRQLHFDIKQDAITFKGTERRNSLSENTNGNGTHAFSIEDAIMSEVKANIDNVISVTNETKPDPTPEPEQEAENNFSLFSDSTLNHSQNPKDILAATPVASDLPQVPEINQELTKLDETKAIESEAATPTLTTATEELKDETMKSTELETSPASASSLSQTKKHSHSREKDKDKRHHSQSRSDDKQRRKSRERERERDRDRDRDREQDKSRSKTSSSSKPSSSSSHSSSSKHRSSTSKNDKSSTSTTSSRSNHESSASKRSSSRHDSSTHKKHKSSSSSSRSDRDRTRSRESRESHSHSHHSRSHNGSGSSKRSDRDKDRDRNKSSSNSTSNSANNSINPPAPAVVQDDHNEVKAKLQKRHSSDSNDEGKPPGASGKSPTESAESQAKEKATDTSTQNGKASETNGANGTNGNNSTQDSQTQNNNNNDDSVEQATVNPIIVTDILQQSSASFIELSSGSAAKKPVEVMTRETDTKSEQQAIDSANTEAESISTEADITTTTNAANESVEEAVMKPEPVVELEMKSDIPAENESLKNMHKEANNTEPSTDLDFQDATPCLESIKESTSVKDDSSQQSLEEGEETFTHFEENAEEFNARLKLIEHNIKDRRLLLNVFSEIKDTRTPSRNSTKRRLSSEASSSKQHSSSSFSSSLGSPNEKVIRTRRDVSKTSPTPSEISVNSKENEEQEKHEKGDLSSRPLSQKLCQQQRYTNDDLYKPRPLLSQRSRRRGLDSIL